MGNNRKSNGKASTVPIGLLYGVIVSILTTLTGTVLIANLIHTERMPWESVGYGILIEIMLASFLGANAAYSKIKHKRLLVSLMSGAVYYCVLLSMTALLFGGQYEAAGVTAGLVLAGCGASGLLGMSAKKAGGSKKTKYRYS